MDPLPTIVVLPMPLIAILGSGFRSICQIFCRLPEVHLVVLKEEAYWLNQEQKQNVFKSKLLSFKSGIYTQLFYSITNSSNRRVAYKEFVFIKFGEFLGINFKKEFVFRRKNQL
jgi:hypothetical protein